MWHWNWLYQTHPNTNHHSPSSTPISWVKISLALEIDEKLLSTGTGVGNPVVKIQTPMSTKPASCGVKEKTKTKVTKHSPSQCHHPSSSLLIPLIKDGTGIAVAKEYSSTGTGGGNSVFLIKRCLWQVIVMHISFRRLPFWSMCMHALTDKLFVATVCFVYGLGFDQTYSRSCTNIAESAVEWSNFNCLGG